MYEGKTNQIERRKSKIQLKNLIRRKSSFHLHIKYEPWISPDWLSFLAVFCLREDTRTHKDFWDSWPHRPSGWSTAPDYHSPAWFYRRSYRRPFCVRLWPGHSIRPSRVLSPRKTILRRKGFTMRGGGPIAWEHQSFKLLRDRNLPGTFFYIIVEQYSFQLQTSKYISITRPINGETRGMH